jgi:hypothetical protein
VPSSAIERVDEASRVVLLPRLGSSLIRELPVQLHELVDETASNRLRRKQRREFRQLREPVGIPRSPVVVNAIGDPKDLMMRLGDFVEQIADLSDHRIIRHGSSFAGADRLRPSRDTIQAVRRQPSGGIPEIAAPGGLMTFCEVEVPEGMRGNDRQEENRLR